MTFSARDSVFSVTSTAQNQNGTLDGVRTAHFPMFTDRRELMTPAEVGEELGITPQQVNNLCRAGKLPSVQISERRRVIPKALLIEWIMQGGNNE